ncbi:MAG: RadC family protein [Sandaracinobacteroides sp.]
MREAPGLFGLSPEDRGKAGPNSDPAGKAGHRNRMRQRLLEGGPDGFHDYELLEYVLGLAIPRQDVKPLAKRLIDGFGDLPTVMAASPGELTRIEGVGESVAAALKFVEALSVRQLQRKALGRPLLSSFDAVVDYLHARLAHELTEEFRVLFLDNRNNLLRDEKFGEGTVNQAPAYPREIVKRALELAAVSIILVHNHPAGDPTPSRDDIQLTRTIADAARAVGIAVHDHLVIARTGHASLRALGHL